MFLTTVNMVSEGIDLHLSSHPFIYFFYYMRDILNEQKYAVSKLDMSKAYEGVSHQILLLKLYKKNMQGVVYNCLESYVTHREYW